MANDVQAARLNLVREDLKTQITDFFPSPGTVIVVHPKPGVQFTPEYVSWLQESLQTLLPPGVKAMVISENITRFDPVAPEDEGYDYLRGWNDALRAIAELNP